MIETEVRLVAISTQNEDPAPLSRDNAPIPLNAIVDAISKTLSPAASFLVCVGSLKEGNYGEGQYVQSFTTTKTLLADDREKMSKSLLDFFSTRPDLYDLQADFGDTRDKENAFTQSLSSEEERHFKKTLLGSWFPTTIRNHENKIRKTVKQQVSHSLSFSFDSYPCRLLQPHTPYLSRPS